MKKYKNIKISLGFYLLGFTLYYILPITTWKLYPDFATHPSFLGQILIYLSVFSVLIGIFFGYKSNHAKESSWLGSLMILIGFLVLLSPLILYFIMWRI